MTAIEITKKYWKIIAGCVLVGFLVYAGVSMANKITEYRNVNNNLESILDFNERQRHVLDSMVVQLNRSISERDSMIAIRDKQIYQHERTIESLRAALKTALSQLEQTTADASYKYINLRIPPVAELKFRFDSTQVKTIHYIFIERDGLFDISNRQAKLISELNFSSLTKDNQIAELKSLNNVYVRKQDLMQLERDLYYNQSTSLTKQVKQQKFLKRAGFLGGIVVGVGSSIAIHSLSK